MYNDSAVLPNNGSVLTISKIIKAVMYSAAEADLLSLFINCREAIPARHALETMGHTQPPTPIQTDNTTALGVITNNIASKQIKSMDMKLHWLRCPIAQKQCLHYWQPGQNNLGDYVTKYHSDIYHRAVHGIYLTPKFKLYLLQRRQLKVASAARVC